MIARPTTSPREIAEPLGYSVLQAIRESGENQGSVIGARKTADVIAELIAAKRREQLSVPYVNRLEDDLKSFAAAVPDEIEKVHAPHIKAFLNGCEVGPRRWNNLRDQVVTLFRFARSERYLPKDRATEAEDVAKMKVARKTVDMFTPEELPHRSLRTPAQVWLPWVLISAYAGVRTFEVLRMDWASIRWEQKLIDLPPEVTKVNERRIIPMCDALMRGLCTLAAAVGAGLCGQSSLNARSSRSSPKVKKASPDIPVEAQRPAPRLRELSHRAHAERPAGCLGNGKLRPHGETALFGGEDLRGRFALVRRSLGRFRIRSARAVPFLRWVAAAA